MADVELVIKIPEEVYKRFAKAPRTATFNECISERKVLVSAIAKGKPLPKGHGRLIDADALVYWECNGDCDMCCDDDKCGMVKEALTIIEADEESEE